MQQKHKVRLHLAWVPQSPVHIDSGLHGEGHLSKYLVRSASGEPLIPGSTVKGRLRFYTLMAYQSLGGALHHEGLPCLCAVCRLFGSPGASPASLAVSDLRPAATSGQLQIAIRSGIALDPWRHVVRDGALLFAEQVLADRFEGKATGFVTGESAERGPQATLGLLGTGIRLVRAIGGAKARGTGHGRFEACLTVDEKQITEEEWRRWAAQWQR